MRLALLSMLLFTPAAWAIDDCMVGDRAINLDNGATTANLTGTVRCFDRDTKQEMRILPFRQGKVHGREVRRWASGDSIEQEYRDGKRHGEFKRFEKGVLTEVSHYVDDHEQGEGLRYYPNGKISRRLDRQPDDAKSTWSDYDETGRLTEAGCGLMSSRPAGLDGCPWKGASPLVFFHSNGQKAQVVPLKAGLREGVTEAFDKEGQRTGATRYVAGLRDGVETTYRNGKPVRATTYAKGQREGDETEFFGDGAKKQVTTWKGREAVKRVEFFQNGERKQEVVVDGTRSVESRFDDRGVLRERTESVRADTYRGWAPDGLSESFHEDGGVSVREHYVRGDLEGRRQVWNESGLLVEDSTWTRGNVSTRKRWDPDGGLVEDDAFYEDGSRKKKP